MTKNDGLRSSMASPPKSPRPAAPGAVASPSPKTRGRGALPEHAARELIAMRLQLVDLQNQLESLKVRNLGPAALPISTTERLKAKLAGTKKRISRALARQRTHFVATEAHLVHSAQARRGEQHMLVAESRNPIFRLHPQGGQFPYGWLQLKIAYTVSFEGRTLPPNANVLIAQSAAKVAASSTQTLHRQGVSSGAPSTHIVFLPPEVVTLHLELSGVPAGAKIQMHTCELTEITRQEVALRTLLRAPPARSATATAVVAGTLRWASNLPRLGIKSSLIAAKRPFAIAVSPYQAWVDAHDTLTDVDRAAITAHIDSFAKTPTFSVVMPVYNPPASALREAIESVRAQLYPHWQLCIVNDASTAAHVAPILDAAAANDPRIHVQHRRENGHICRASNDGVAMATGDFIALLDHDDLLPDHALYRVAVELLLHPDCDIVYSDEDKIDAQGRRFNPYFKHDFDVDLLLGQNTISHLGVYRTSLVRRIGGFRPGYEGSQDYDLVLRASRLAGAKAVRHIPQVLYHWRAISGSTAVDADAKPYAQQAAHRAVSDHLRHTDPGASCVATSSAGLYRTTYPVPDPEPSVSIIIPTRDRVDLLRQCVASLIELTQYTNYEILILDNDSACATTCAYLAELDKMPQVRVIAAPGPFNYPAINNLGAQNARSDLLCLLNNDIEIVDPGWLREMVSHALREGVGAVGARLMYPDGKTVQHAGVVLGLGGVASHAFQHLTQAQSAHFGNDLLVRRYSAVTAACMVVRRDLWLKVGGLDPKLQVAFNDIDFCLRLGALGLRCLYTPHALLLHHESASRGKDVTAESLKRFNTEQAHMLSKWGHLIDNDPCYNPNLTRENSDFSLSHAPRIERPWRAFFAAPSLAPKPAHSAQR